jgi:hypothetical protein
VRTIRRVVPLVRREQHRVQRGVRASFLKAEGARNQEPEQFDFSALDLFNMTPPSMGPK